MNGELFGDRPTRPGLIGFRVTEAERQRLEAEAQRRGLSLSQLTRAALGYYLNGDGGQAVNHEPQN